MPEKKCPDCNKSQHVRVRECACGYIFPRKTKKSNKELSQHDVDYVFNGWKVVPARTRNAKCGLCSKKMKGGMNSWHSSYTDGENEVRMISVKVEIGSGFYGRINGK